MGLNKEIEEMIAEDNFQGALEKLSALIGSCSNNAELYFERGKLHWRIGNRRDAVKDLLKASELDGDSPAKQYLEHINGIMAFYDKDRYNP